MSKKKRAQDKLLEQSLVISRFYEQEKYAKRLSDALNKINSEVMSTLNFDKVAKKVIDQASSVVKCDSSGLVLRENGKLVLKYSYGLPAEAIGTKFSELQFSELTLALATTKKPIVIKDASTDERIPIELTNQFKVRSVLVVPLLMGDELIGIIAFNFRSATLINEVVIDFAVKFAYSLTLANINTRLFKVEKNIADTLQESLLTAPEKIVGVDFGNGYKSSTADLAKVGGDFYDIFELKDRCVGIIVGDVSGKGIEAAKLTSMVKNTIRAYAYADVRPSLIMTRANELVKKSIAAEMFVTIFFAVLDKKSRELIYCSAGHPPSILRRKSSKIEFLTTNSPVMGVFDNLRFIEGKKTLEKDDILVVYTDGVTEARRQNGEFYGEERFVKFIEGLKTPSAKNVPRKILDEIKGFSRDKIVDDIAIISLSLV